MTMIPLGVIAIWNGAIIEIPVGWAYCDGSAGTPDLRDKFVICSGPLLPQGSNATIFTHDHSYIANAHTHTIPPGSEIAAGTDFDETANSEVLSGDTDAATHIPPYKSLVYMMKL